MADFFFTPDADYTLNYCTKYLARYNTDERHAQSGSGTSGTICEAWRFPIVDIYAGGASAVADPAQFSFYNQVTFIYQKRDEQSANSVQIIGTFSNLFAPIPLVRTPFFDAPTPFWSISFAVPKQQVHRYRFVVDGQPRNDAINPQTLTLPTGRTWSRFFTWECTSNLVLEDWEFDILGRLVEQIAPFRTEDGQRFLDQFYNYQDYSAKVTTFEHAYRFDESVGEISFIDNILAREESHRLNDYKICLSLIKQILRQRNPYEDPALISKEVYNDLYNEMASDNVDGWDTTKYQSPLFFLNLLRRHACTGSFSHPKYGGNATGAGWAYLSERYNDSKNNTLFAWRDAIQPSLGTSTDYLG